MAAVTMHHFSGLGAPFVRSKGTVSGGVFKNADVILLKTPCLLRGFRPNPVFFTGSGRCMTHFAGRKHLPEKKKTPWDTLEPTGKNSPVHASAVTRELEPYSE